MNSEDDDRIVWRPELMERLDVSASETIRRYLRDKKLPPPDVDMSQRKRGWKVSTLRAAGIHIA